MPKVPKKRKYTVSLSESEMHRLTVYAATCGIDRPTALARLVRQSLRQVAGAANTLSDENQLRLFDTLQIDIFNQTTKVNNKD